jgi:hypothetical protein
MQQTPYGFKSIFFKVELLSFCQPRRQAREASGDLLAQAGGGARQAETKKIGNAAAGHWDR